MNMPIYKSTLAKWMNDFVAFKQLQKFTYMDQALCLRYFDDFLVEKHFCASTLNRTIVELYIAPTQRYKPNTRYNRLSIVREFSRYLKLYERESYVLSQVPAKRPSYPRFYIYSDHEIAALIRMCFSLKPLVSHRTQTFATLIGLLATTGLRINEALSITLDDVDLEKQLLFIRKGKFSKDRWVPLSLSATHALGQYITIRKEISFNHEDNSLFLNQRKKKLRYDSVQNTFRHLIRQCQIRGNQPPRLHDLRHTYATKCLLKWYQHADINAKLPALATCMGHVNISSTQIYLHITAEIRAQAQRRFQENFNKNILNKGERT
ncbi:tyrosine-type recombinase/integrase [candidate division CSSED10-310 bacterium]|uniref:Tyrosine-type recombinase/integrase n=1 Tax=candidate division CSSED10-310 bacterium TaxID=2855610 RepID=A0ABV6Z4B9_UNCC1